MYVGHCANTKVYYKQKPINSFFFSISYYVNLVSVRSLFMFSNVSAFLLKVHFLFKGGVGKGREQKLSGRLTPKLVYRPFVFRVLVINMLCK